MYELTWGAFGFGVLLLAAGVVFLRFHRPIADNIGGGVGSYEKYKLWALILCGIGLLWMVNLPAFLLDATLGSVFRR